MGFSDGSEHISGNGPVLTPNPVPGIGCLIMCALAVLTFFAALTLAL